MAEVTETDTMRKLREARRKRKEEKAAEKEARQSPLSKTKSILRNRSKVIDQAVKDAGG